METELLNGSYATGLYNSVSTTLESNVVATQMVSGLTILKSADKAVWATGTLLYTIVVTNNALEPFTAVNFTDTLDITKITLVPNSVRVNDVVATYTFEGALLTVPLQDLAVGASVTITFQVSKV